MHRNPREIYRRLIRKEKLKPFQVVVKETDLSIYAETDCRPAAVESVLKHRGYIEAHIRRHPEFFSTLAPWTPPEPCHQIIQEMVRAARIAGVGPMAAVAGVIAEFVGQDLLAQTKEIIVENGGDVYIHTVDPVIVGIYAGTSPLSMKLGIRVDAPDEPVTLCTSTGTFGHSLSMGKADAVCVRSASGALSDAVATALGNRVKSQSDIHAAISFGKQIENVTGVLVIAGDELGAWGDMEMVPLEGKKP